MREKGPEDMGPKGSMRAWYVLCAMLAGVTVLCVAQCIWLMW